MINQKLLKSVSLLLVCCLLVVLPGTCFAAETYQITEQELTELQANFTQLEVNNNQLLTELATSKADLVTAKNQLTEYQAKLAKSQQDLTALKAQLQTLQAESMQAKNSLLIAQASLQTANESLTTYVKEVKAETTKLKIERDIGWIAFVIAAFRK